MTAVAPEVFATAARWSARTKGSTCSACASSPASLPSCSGRSICESIHPMPAPDQLLFVSAQTMTCYTLR